MQFKEKLLGIFVSHSHCIFYFSQYFCTPVFFIIAIGHTVVYVYIILEAIGEGQQQYLDANQFFLVARKGMNFLEQDEIRDIKFFPEIASYLVVAKGFGLCIFLIFYQLVNQFFVEVVVETDWGENGIITDRKFTFLHECKQKLCVR